MIQLPSGVNINNLIDDIRNFSWQAADILLYYSKLLEDSDDKKKILKNNNCLLYTSPSPRDGRISRMPSSA